MKDSIANSVKPATLLAQAIARSDSTELGIISPTHISTTYIRDADNQYRSGFSYARPHNPTTRQAESIINQLEAGTGAMLFASGMAAATTVFLCLESGDHVLAPEVMYWSLRQWLSNNGAGKNLDIEFINMDDPVILENAIKPGKTKLVWLETPGNPLWNVVDIRRAAEIAHKAGAMIAVDSTVQTPILCQPLLHGADIVMHSATKYLNGHTDVVAGALITREDNAYWQKMQDCRRDLGGILSPRDAAQLIRGMRTLHLRVKASCASALEIAQHCEKHDAISRVRYPGLPAHPGHEIAKHQMNGGFGGMLSIEFHGGAEAAISVAANLKLWKRATSLGGVESLVEHRASVEGETTPVPQNLLRLSVGIEDCSDLISDLNQAFASIN